MTFISSPFRQITELFRHCSAERIRVVAMASLLAVVLLAVLYGYFELQVRGEADPIERRQSQAVLSEQVSIQAAGRGNPWINLNDGREVLAAYSGPAELQEALEQNQAQARSLASADFDEDGVPDLVSGYAAPSGGIITLHKGNIDSIYPNSAETKQRKVSGEFTDSPFLSPASIFSLPAAPDFIGAGDFNADGHWDVVAASRKDNRLCLLRGDGKGGLSAAEEIELPGRVTAMTVGEINRRDGLDDIVIGVSSAEGAKVLVYEGPEGALRSKPEVFTVSAEVTSLALGQLDDSYEMDLAVAAGKELVVVHGRDRKLSLDGVRQAQVPPASIRRRSFAFNVRSIAPGDFSGNHTTDIALLADDGAVYLLSKGVASSSNRAVSLEVEQWGSKVMAQGSWSEAAKLVSVRVASVPMDNLVVVDANSRQLQVMAGEAEGLRQNTADIAHAAAYQRAVASLDMENGAAAVLPMRLNSDALSDLVVLRSNESRPSVVTTAAGITFTVTNVNDSGPGSLRQAILDANNNQGTDTIRFNISGSGSHLIRLVSQLPEITDAVTMDGSSQSGEAVPVIELSGSNIVSSPFVIGLYITAGNSVVRGVAINGFNNSYGEGIRLELNGNDIIEGSYIGTNISGTISIGNSFGITISSDFNRVGGTVPDSRNLISGNIYSGIIIGGKGNKNLVQGNYIGTDITGTQDLGNSNVGVYISGGSDNLVGGTIVGSRNVISGNGDLNHGYPGVAVFTSQEGPASGNLIQENFIGTDVRGNVKLGNSLDGIAIDAPNTTVGGTTPTARNIISGNGTWGIEISSDSAKDNLVEGNYIGTDLTGTAAVGNAVQGILITETADGTAVGGAIAGARNIISGNQSGGIALGIRTTDLAGNTVFGQKEADIQGNYIGTDVSGINPVSNNSDGIFVDANCISNRIIGNRIAFNQGSGIRIPNDPSTPDVPRNPAVQIKLINNSIYSNNLLGIDLGPFGPTPNPHNQLTGANLLQNFPELTSVSTASLDRTLSGVRASAISLTVSGRLSASPNTDYTVEFFFGSNCEGQGHEHTGAIPISVGTKQVRTDGNGDAAFTYMFVLPLGNTNPTGFVNCTATDPVGNTSEFCQCVGVAATPSIATVSRSGKNLVIVGQNFSAGAVVMINNERRKTLYDDQHPTTTLIAKKAGKTTRTGDKVQVRNFDGTMSLPFYMP